MSYFPTAGARPLVRLTAHQLCALADESVLWGNKGVAMLCAEEASHRRNTILEDVLKRVGNIVLPSKAWLAKAEKAAKVVTKPGPGTHSVYVILLFNPKAHEPYGMYVGESSHSPKDRFAQHRAGIKAGRAAKRYGICLLPRFFQHLNRFQKADRLKVECALAEALRKAGFWVEGPRTDRA